jgi:hypothetical protein
VERVGIGRRGVMLRDTDVPTMMMRVEAALSRASRAKTASGPIYVHAEGDSEFGIAKLRGPAKIEIEFFSGSGRPVIGPSVRFAKRAVRRALRWYIAPVAEQQTRFNHAALDLVERLRMQNERLETEMETLRSRYERDIDRLNLEIESLRGESSQ